MSVFVVVPAYNRCAMTQACVAGLMEQTRPADQIVVVDGGSRDGTPAEVASRFPQAVVLEPELGQWFWGQAMARGIEWLLRNGAVDNDVLVMMNDDTIIPPDYLEVMERVCLRERAAVGALIVDAADRSRLLDAGEKVNWLAYNYPVLTEPPASGRLREDVDFLPGRGSALLVGMVRAAGNVDAKTFPHYLADYDFFLRVRKSGFRLGVTGETWIASHHQATGISALTTPFGLRVAMRLATSRRSMDNVTDHTRFILRHAPTMGLKLRCLVIVLKRSLAVAVPPGLRAWWRGRA